MPIAVTTTGTVTNSCCFLHSWIVLYSNNLLDKDLNGSTQEAWHYENALKNMVRKNIFLPVLLPG